MVDNINLGDIDITTPVHEIVPDEPDDVDTLLEAKLAVCPYTNPDDVQ